jgi:hypothetical protein
MGGGRCIETRGSHSEERIFRLGGGGMKGGGDGGIFIIIYWDDRYNNPMMIQ